MARSIERRACRRFALTLPVLFRWSDNLEHYDVGQCANVGMGGMFIFTTKGLPVGTDVEVEFVIPAFDRMPRELRFRCIGQVSRIESCYQFAGFAVKGRLEGEQQDEQLERMAVSLAKQ